MRLVSSPNQSGSDYSSAVHSNYVHLGSIRPRSAGLRSGRWRLLRWMKVGAIAFALIGCSSQAEEVPPRRLEMQQQWDLQPGSVVSGQRIIGGLGDISVDLEGGAIHAPFDGKVQPHDHDCFIYSSPEIPAYLFRLCGLEHANLGDIRRGEVLGRGSVLQFAVLRKQPSGQWAMVEPSVSMLESILAKP